MTRLMFGLALLGLLAAPLHAQSPTAAIEALELKRFKAMADNDLQTLATLLADDLVYTHSSGTADSKAVYLEALRSGKSRYHSAVSQSMNVRIIGETALINGRVQVTVESNGKKQDMLLSYLDVWARRGGAWQMVAWQSARVAAPQ
jgi:ketosteroid isomerase-like protein